MYMDFSYYSQDPDYVGLVVKYFFPLSELLSKKIKQIGNYSRIYVFGFSLGSWMAIEAGHDATNGSIPRMDLCDPAGPLFDFFKSPIGKPKTSGALLTSCIDTSNNFGSTVYDCDQNWRMGDCGFSQPAAGPYPLGSHGLCPYFYNSAFEYKFASNGAFDKYSCSSNRFANLTSLACDGAAMGYLANYDRKNCIGDIFVDTAANSPYYVS